MSEFYCILPKHSVFVFNTLFANHSANFRHITGSKMDVQILGQIGARYLNI